MIPQGCWWWLWGTSAASRTGGFVHRVMASTRPNTGLMESGAEWRGGGGRGGGGGVQARSRGGR